jgi:O-antigen/teichoic acid export membrane protein
MDDIKDKVLRGGLVRILTQLTMFGIRFGTLMVLARVLTPNDFGLMAMVATFTGIVNLLRDFGLSNAMVQRPVVTPDLLSTLFWANLLIGLLCATLIAAASPVLVSFYGEPRLHGIAIALAAGFLINAAGVQHVATLERQMRFDRLALNELTSVAISGIVAIVAAGEGAGYWSLVAMSVSIPLISTGLAWKSAGWMPGWPKGGTGIRSLMHFGATTTLNAVVVYVAYNLDKVLLGRICGTEQLGIYTRGYQLANLPIENLNGVMGSVALSALSRIQNDPQKFRTYFLRGYSLVLSITIPIALSLALLSDDVVRVALGEKWSEVGPVLRALSPTVIVFALINPLGPYMCALGLVRRSLLIAMTLTPVVIAGYVVGLPYGPLGVATGFSSALVIWVTPHVLLCVRGTAVSPKDILWAAGKPLLAGLIATAFVLCLKSASVTLPAVVSLIVWGGLIVVVHFGALIFLLGEKDFYFGIKRRLLEPLKQPVAR